ncbi:MAG: carboxypeptidase-like regulatory domain-containing protein, partial [Candidatus Kapaibacterium sp.]
MEIRITLSLLLGLAVVAGCKNSTIVQNSDVGSFRGNVALINAEGDTLSNYAGATAHIEGTVFQATSNAAGDWEIDNVPAGIYNISLTKPGFDTLIIPKYQFSGAGVSFVMSTAIQALPLDSLVFTLSNTIEEYYDSAHTSYLGLINIRGGVSGPDSLDQEFMDVSSDSGFTSDGTIQPYLFNDTLVGAAIGYSVGYSNGNSFNKSGTVITIRSHLL